MDHDSAVRFFFCSVMSPGRPSDHAYLERVRTRGQAGTSVALMRIDSLPEGEPPLLDSRPWKSAPTSTRLPFHLDGDAVPASATSARRSWISAADGVVARVETSKLWVAEDTVVALHHAIPSVFDLSLLVGRRIRIALLHAASADGALAQTLTIATASGDPLVVAHAGEARGIAHTLGKLSVYVALSQRPGGPMVFGTARLQSIVRVGDHIRVRGERDSYIMQLESRSGSAATYAIGVEELWKGPPSTVR